MLVCLSAKCHLKTNYQIDILVGNEVLHRVEDLVNLSDSNVEGL